MLRLAVKYKTIFNHISERIKDKIEEKPVLQEEVEKDKTKKLGKKGVKEVKPKAIEPEVKVENEFESGEDINIKELIKENNEGKDDVD